MGKSTFSKEQRDYLVNKVPEFREAQVCCTVTAFFYHLYTDWFSRWPVADEADADDGDSVASSDDHLEGSSREAIIKVRRSLSYSDMY